MRRTSARTLIYLFSSCVLLAAGAGEAPAQETIAADALESYTERVATGFVNWGAGYAEVEVEAPYETERFGGSHAKIRAIEAADELAATALYRLVRGLNITGEKRLAGDPALEEALQKMVKKQSSRVTQKTANVTMTATYRMPIFGRKALSGTVQSMAFGEAPHGELAATSGGGYTSVVLDASSTSLQAALLPRIVSEDGTLLWGPGDVDPKVTAPVVYAVRGAGDAKESRLPKPLAKAVGDNPLVIKVEKVGGEFAADVVLRPEQVDRLRGAQPGDLLTQGKLYIIHTASIDTTQS